MTTNELTTASAAVLNEFEAVRSAYVGAAVTEIASLRAALGAPLQG